MSDAPGALRVRAAATLAILPLLFAGCDGNTGPETDLGAPPHGEFAQSAPAGISEPATSASFEKIDPELQAALIRGEARDVIVLLDDRDLRRAALVHEVLASETGLGLLERAYDAQKARLFVGLKGKRARLLHDYPHLPLGFFRVESADALATLAAHPDVLRVMPDRALRRTAMPNLELIRQPMLATTGIDGSGATVVVLDSGLDYKNQAFGCTAPGVPSTCKVAAVRDIAPDDKALDDDGHGTNVAGIVLSVAPGAKVIGLDVFDGEYAWTSTLLEAVNWVIENRAKYNIAALNMSLGGGTFTTTCGSTGMAEAIANAREAGVLSVVAAGNEGLKDALAFPACAPAAVSVGAVYDSDLGSLVTDVCSDQATAADQIACFSNSASFLTILAPGVDISAAGMTMSGTSQAAPHVAGAIALLRAHHPKESATALLARLTAAGPRITDKRNNVSRPRLDLGALMRDALPPGPKAPGGEVRINAGAKATGSTRVTLALRATSGEPVELCVSNGSTCTGWRPVSTTLPWTVPSGDGTKRVAVWWRDAEGRTSVQPTLAYVRLDTTPPTDGLLRRVSNGRAIELRWSGFSDGGSGVVGYKLVSATGGPPPAGCGGGGPDLRGEVTSMMFTINAGGPSTYFRLCAVDAVGIWSTGLVTSAGR